MIMFTFSGLGPTHIISMEKIMMPLARVKQVCISKFSFFFVFAYVLYFPNQSLWMILFTWIVDQNVERWFTMLWFKRLLNEIDVYSGIRKQKINKTLLSAMTLLTHNVIFIWTLIQHFWDFMGVKWTSKQRYVLTGK